MNLTPNEISLLLLSLYHMEEHLFNTWGAGDITLDTFNLRLETWNNLYKKINKL